jgi:sugar phosphate isomerase/epimerase
MTASLRRLVLPGLMLGLAVLNVPRSIAQAAEPKNPFFAYCVGIGVEPSLGTPAAQKELAPMLAELGYDGMALPTLDGAESQLAALESHKQKLLAVYAPLNVDPGDRGYDPRLKELIPKLAGHDTTVWLFLTSRRYKPSSTDGDARAVELLRQLSDAARPHGVHISLYPHLTCYAQRIEDVVRLAKQVNRKNVGVTFTFCHFLALDSDKNLDRAIELARPYLNMVTINGTNGYDAKNFSAWIKTLDQGSFDVSRVLKALRKFDYRGPIGVICYGIHGDRREILARSMKGWKEISARANQAK